MLGKPRDAAMARTVIRFGAGLGIVLCLLTAGLPAGGQGTGQNVIRGKVLGPDGHHLDRIEVNLRLVTRNIISTALTDSKGDFDFKYVADGNYLVTIDSDEYQPAVVTARVAWPLYPVANVLVSLVANSSSQKTAPTGFRKNSPTISIEELNARFPKKAVKEYERGNSEMQRGKIEVAILRYENALTIAPAMYPALNNLGNAYLRAGQLPKAETVFRRALSADPQAAEPCVNLGHLFYEQKRYDEAEKFLLQGLERSPQSALGHFLLGSTYARLGDAKKAETNLREALDEDEPEVAMAHLELANLYLNTNRLRGAREHLEAFLRVRPQDPQAEHVRQILARLNNQPQ